MKEVKPSKKPLAIYYAIVLLVLLVLNLVFVPWLTERQVKEVDYGTFMSMTAEKQIGKVDIQSNQIVFTDKEEKQIYKTGLMNDPGLTQRRCRGPVLQRDRGAGLPGAELFDLVCPAHPAVQLYRQPDEQKAHGKGRRRPRSHDVWRRRQIQRQGLCAVHPRHPLCRCGRRGRGQGEPAGDRQLPP